MSRHRRTRLARRAADYIEADETIVEKTRANSRLFDILDRLPIATEGTDKLVEGRRRK